MIFLIIFKFFKLFFLHIIKQRFYKKKKTYMDIFYIIIYIYI